MSEKPPGSSSSVSTDDDNEKERLRRELEEAQNMIRALQFQLNAQKERPSKLPGSSRPSELPHPSEKPSETSTEASFEEAKALPAPKPVRSEVGVSYDSSKMRSTLSHIDIEEMCRCLSKAVHRHILHAKEVALARETNSRESGVRTSVNSMPFEGEGGEAQQEAGEIKVQKAAEELFMMAFGDDRAVPGKIPDETQIYYFCKNVVIKCRMEKECSIVCLIYIERLITKTGLYITEMNWKKLIFTSLILASKVWDDESYENTHFARAFTMYELRTINDMERVFLDLVDYNVHVIGSEYAKYYFVLRTLAEKSNRSFPLRSIDADKVRKLQSKASMMEDSLRTMHEKAGPITF